MAGRNFNAGSRLERGVRKLRMALGSEPTMLVIPHAETDDRAAKLKKRASMTGRTALDLTKAPRPSLPDAFAGILPPPEAAVRASVDKFLPSASVALREMMADRISYSPRTIDSPDQFVRRLGVVVAEAKHLIGRENVDNDAVRNFVREVVNGLDVRTTEELRPVENLDTSGMILNRAPDSAMRPEAVILRQSLVRDVMYAQSFAALDVKGPLR